MRNYDTRRVGHRHFQFSGKLREMSDRTNATIRHILAQWGRIIRGAVARAEANRQRTIMAGFRAFLDWSTERTQPARVRQETIMSGFRTFLDWSYVRRKRIRARRNWDYFRAFGIPTVRHFLSYERKGRYKWTAPYVSKTHSETHMSGNAYVSQVRQLDNYSTARHCSTARQLDRPRQTSTDLDTPAHAVSLDLPRRDRQLLDS